MTPKAGRELDALVAEKVFGESVSLGGDPGGTIIPWVGELDGIQGECPPYSTNIAAAWEVVEKLREITHKCVLVEASINPTEYLCTLGWHHRGQWFKDFQVGADTAPEAICLAALKAVEGRKEANAI